MERKLASFLCGLFLLSNLVAQQKYQSFLRFDNTTWNVGRISENTNKQIYVFRFINVHTEAVVIEQVKTTCGCTVAAYTKRPIRPQERGTIQVTFNPQGLVNHFSKTLRVICGEGKSVNYLRITGFVETTFDPETDFPYSLAEGVSVSQLVLSLRNIQQNAMSKMIETQLYNQSNKRVSLSFLVENASGCIHVEMPKEIKAKGMEVVRISAVAPKGFYGSFNDRIVLYVNGQRTQALEVYGTAVDDMRGVSILNGPKLRLSAHTFELGKLKPDIQISRTVRITNQGKSPLAVRKLECEENISTDISKEIILKPGETQDLKFVITPRKGSRLKADVKLVSNDPKSPVRMIRFAGEVME